MTSGSTEPVISGSPDHGARHARLTQPRVIVAARLGWLAVAALSLTLFLIEIRTVYKRLQTLQQYDPRRHQEAVDNLAHLGLSVNQYATYMLALTLILALACFAVGIIIGLRRSSEPMALFVASLLVTLGAASVDPIAVLGRSVIKGNSTDLLYWLNFFENWFSFVTVVLLLLLFPNLRFQPRWSRWLAPLTLLLWQMPLSESWWRALNLSLVGAVLAISVSAQNYRYHHTLDEGQRRQTRLVAIGFTIAGCGFIFDQLCYSLSILQPGTLAYMIESAIMTVCVLCIPASFGIAILRYHLWDLDLIINRTLVYAPVTAVLTGLFAGMTKLFQDLFDQYTGAGSFGTVLSIVVVVAAFTPVKNGVQALVDRHMRVAPKAPPPAGAALAAAGTAVGNSDSPNAGIEELREEIAALRSELAEHEAAEQELHQAHATIEHPVTGTAASAPPTGESAPASNSTSTPSQDLAE